MRRRHPSSTLFPYTTLFRSMLVARRGSSLVSDFGGAGKYVPLLAGIFLIAGLASLALPGMSPFVSEFLVLIGTFRSEEHTSELQSHVNLVCRLLLEKKKNIN